MMFFAVFTQLLFTFWTTGTLTWLTLQNLMDTLKVPLHILNTCNTDTRVHCKILLISEIWLQLPLFRCWCRDIILVSFDTLWSSVQSIQNPSSDSKHLQHGHPYSLFIAKFSNFWNMMATSIIQMLVSWYDSGIFWYTVVFCAVYTESFTFWTPATWTPVVVVRFSNFWNMMATSGIQMLLSWYDSGYLSMYCGVLYRLNNFHLHIRNTCNTDIRVRCKILQFLYKICYSDVGIVIWYWYLSKHCGLLCSLCRILLHILNTCNTDTCAPCRII